MPTSTEVANKLRLLADRIESSGLEEMDRPFILLSAQTSEKFKAYAASLPRPFTKKIDYEHTSYPDLSLTHDDPAAHINVRVPQSRACRLVSPAIPAKYECDPILSADEQAELEAEVR